MAQKSHPKRGSRGYWPRKRIQSLVPRFNAWPERGQDAEPRLQGYAGYKAGMTHVMVRDPNKNSTTADQEVQWPVTVLEVPPMKVAAIRAYASGPYGLHAVGEVWADKLDKHLERLLTLGGEGGRGAGHQGKKGKPKAEKKADKKAAEVLSKGTAEKLSKIDPKTVSEVRVLAHTLPHLVSGIPKKVPDLMEVRVGGGTVEKRLEYARSLLGKEVSVQQFAEDGMMVDVASITKGKGFQGTIKKWHPKLLSHKNSKHRRLIGTLGPHFPSYVQRTVPQSGQMGLHQRTEFNKRILHVGNDGEDVTPAGGFLNYGSVRNGYLVIQGSVPGTPKRLVKLRDAIRCHGPTVEKAEVLYISKESKQGS